MMAVELQKQTEFQNLIQENQFSPKKAPILLLIFASAFVVTTIVLSNQRDWIFLYRIIALCFAFTYLLSILFRKIEFIRPDAIYYIFLIWSIIGLIGSYDTLNLVSVYVKFFTLFQLMFMTYLLFSLAIHMGSTTWLEGSYVIGVFISMAWIFLETGGNFGHERIAGPLSNPNVLAFALLFSLVLSLKLLRAYGGIFIKILLLLNMAIIFPFLVATGSRKGVIAFFLILAVAAGHHLFFEQRKERIKSVIFVFLLVVLTLTICLPMLQESRVYTRLQNIERFAKGEDLVVRERSIYQRMEFYTQGFQLALKYPLFGVGHDQFRYYDSSLRQGSDRGFYSHSNIIEVLANTGFLGFIIYHSAYLLIIIRILSIWKKNNSALVKNTIYFSLMIGMLIITYDFFAVRYYSKDYWIALALICSSLKLAKLSIKNCNVSL